MPFIPKRPAALAHLSDEVVARALSKRFGNVKRAAEDLNVDCKDLRRLTWNNPAILNAAHERMRLFIFVRRDEIMRGLLSKVGSVRRRAIDRMAANPALFGDLDHPLSALLTPARRSRGHSHSAAVDKADEARLARERLEREAAAELAREREIEGDRLRERERERERIEVMVERPSAPAPASTVSLWPPGIRRPSRGRRW
jgi:hypothetical protein